ncbi:MAG: hypothetical protein IPL78_33400 [Chloroflexi bacterium]|nr:hypothetical protein [Chloroflexota bacterium]
MGEEFLLDQEALGALTIEVRQEAEEIFGGEEFVIVSAGSQTGFTGYGLVVQGVDAEGEELAEVVEAIKATISAGRYGCQRFTGHRQCI